MLGTDELTILSVDDNPMMAEAIERIITSSSRMRYEGHFFSGEGVVETVARKNPAIVLLDLEMPDTDTFLLIRELTDAAPDSRVIMLSGHLRRDDILACIDAGAYGYIHKSRPAGYIREAIEKVARGEFVICDQAANAAGFN